MTWNWNKLKCTCWKLIGRKQAKSSEADYICMPDDQCCILSYTSLRAIYLWRLLHFTVYQWFNWNKSDQISVSDLSTRFARRCIIWSDRRNTWNFMLSIPVANISNCMALGNNASTKLRGCLSSWIWILWNSCCLLMLFFFFLQNI